jgi:hypothetical protein
MSTAMTAKDGQVFERCVFTYDASLTESGTLVNSSQSLMDQLVWGRLINCAFYTGSVNLPSMTSAAISESSPLFLNCRFRSASAAGVNLWGRYQGYNYIDYAGTATLNIGTKSRIENGDIILNGTGQASPVSLPDGDYGDVKVSSSGSVMKVESVNLATANFPINAPAATDCNVSINADAGRTKGLFVQVGGLTRWFAGVDSTAEGGSNSGAPYALMAFDDAGGFLGYAMTITRSTRNVVFNKSVTSSGATSGIGYSTGAGGTVTQATSKSTGVTLNTVCGQITMNAAALAAGTIVSFVLTNSAIAATDMLILNHVSGGTPGSYSLNARAAGGSATIDVRNNTAGSLSEAIVIGFSVIKGVTS